MRVTMLSGVSDVLAHTQIHSRQRAGRYAVDVDAFERTVLPELVRSAEVFLIDEIGKMECFSPRFVQAVRDVLDGPTAKRCDQGPASGQWPEWSFRGCDGWGGDGG